MFIILLLLWIEAVFASSVLVALPPDEQYPLIARINSPYSWSLSPSTFASTKNAPINYSVSSLPRWLSFDPASRTFQGTPSPQDEGSPRIKITGQDTSTSDSASAWLDLCVTPYAPPALQTSVAAQFTDTNPSLSSVFLLAPNSALASGNPMLRIPPRWSFSIGFRGDTYVGPNDVFYAVRQVDGSPLPPWMVFSPDEVTLDGVAPPLHLLATPRRFSLMLLASDQKGFLASGVPFDVVIAEHELSVADGHLPTINVTSSSPFNVSLNSPADFSGVLVDNQPIELGDITSVSVDTSRYSDWMQYDEGTRRLTGQPPKDLDGVQAPSLPVTLTTSFNQTAQTSVSVAIVPSYFSQADCSPILVAPGQDVNFDLAPYLSNRTSFGSRPDDVNLTASYEPKEAAGYLNFNGTSALLTGTIPGDVSSDYAHITVTFAAYSRITHSTSHADLPISLTPADFKHSEPTAPSQSGQLSPAGRRKLILGLAITFGILGGAIVLGLLLALFKRCARVKDSALGGDEASRAWSDKDRQWYGVNDNQPSDVEKGYGYADMRRRDEASPDNSVSLDFQHVSSPPSKGGYQDLGLGLHRVVKRLASDPQSPPRVGSPGQVSKGEFMGRLRATVRQVSNKYRGPKKSVIGRPILLLSADDAQMRMNDLARGSPQSLTPLTGDRNMPRGPRNPPAARMKGGKVSGHRGSQPSLESLVSVADSLASGSSTRTHATEAVVHQASRAMSVRSMKSTDAQSYHSHYDESGAPVRPRLVPFTSSSRVPVPSLPESAASGDPGSSSPNDGTSSTKSKTRVVSQRARVMRDGVQAPDELSVGMHYVRALGEDQEAGPSMLSARSPSGSFSSLESSHQARSSLGSGSVVRKGEDMLRILVRAGERFRFRLHIRAHGGAAQLRALEARTLSGRPLPPFLYADLDLGHAGGKHKDTVKFWGVPLSEDVGDIHVGVFGADGMCVGRAVIEVIPRGG